MAPTPRECSSTAEVDQRRWAVPPALLSPRRPVNDPGIPARDPGFGATAGRGSLRGGRAAGAGRPVTKMIKTMPAATPAMTQAWIRRGIRLVELAVGRSPGRCRTDLPSLPFLLRERELGLPERQVPAVKHFRDDVGAIVTWKFTSAGLPSLSS